jgi:hypothetical protein
MVKQTFAPSHTLPSSRLPETKRGSQEYGLRQIPHALATEIATADCSLLIDAHGKGPVRRTNVTVLPLATRCPATGD